MVHFQNGPIIEASTSEWAVKKQLFKTNDHAAFANLGRVFAQRCLESGFIELHCDLRGQWGGKLHAFLKEVKSGGVNLGESSRARVDKFFDHYEARTERPYEELE